MKPENLFESIEHVDEKDLEHSESKRVFRPWWAVAAAAALVVMVGLGVLLRPWFGSAPLQTAAIRQAQYPEMPAYPDENDTDFDSQWDAWWEAKQASRQEEGFSASLDSFWRQCLPAFLSGQEGENRVCSPLNIYLSLAMLAELTDGDSREQILGLLGSETIEDSRDLAHRVWNSLYVDDGAGTVIPASSLWLREDIGYVEETMALLAENYYASSFQGEMGSAEMDQALQGWLNDQTGGLLEREAGDIHLSQDTVLALACTLYFQGKWTDEFQPGDTSPQTFHSPAGDVTVDFMHEWKRTGTYYWGDRFGAVSRGLGESGASMWFLLPDEGVTPEELLSDPQVQELLLSREPYSTWAQQKDLLINLAVPKFDVASQMDLGEGMRALGVTDVFQPGLADFSPATTDWQGPPMYLSQAQHDVRVTIDEEGVTAAAYTVMAAAGAAMPPEEEMDFVLDRPFLFVIQGGDAIPLFVGIVNQP